MPFKVDTVDSYVASLEDIDLAKLNTLMVERENQCHDILKDAGVKERDIKIERMADISFEGQGFPMTVPIPAGPLKPNHLEIIEKSFLDHYIETHGRAIKDVPLRVFNWRIFGIGPSPEVNFKFSNFPTKGSGNPLKGTQRIFLPETKGFRKVNVYNRYLLRPNQKFKGPALVE